MKLLIGYTLVSLTAITGVCWFFDYIKSCYYVFYAKKVVPMTSKWITGLSKNFLMILLITSIRLFAFEPFIIGSNSMDPTLLPGNCILVQKLLSNDQNIVQNKGTLNYHPFRNNFIALQNTKNSKLCDVKSIADVLEDKIIYNLINKILKIIEPEKNKNISYVEQIKEINNLNNHDNQKNEKDRSNKVNKNDFLVVEIPQKPFEGYTNDIKSLQSVKNHLTDINHNNDLKKWEKIISENLFFIISDHKENIRDNRSWGLTAKENIIGKAKYIWYNFFYRYLSSISQIRWSRIFQYII